MSLPAQLAKHFSETYFGGNWTGVCLRDTLADVTWKQAIASVEPCNTIAQLTYHIHYYAQAIRQVLSGGLLDAKDRYSFDAPPIRSEADWLQVLSSIWAEADSLTELIAQLPEEQLGEVFTDGKYGTYYRNLLGLIEHTHYHLGQIVLLKKLLPMT